MTPDEITVTLEKGGPWEIPVESRSVWTSAARKYLSRDHPPEAKERVEAVWIRGQHRRPWHEFKDLPHWTRYVKKLPPHIQAVMDEVDTKGIEAVGQPVEGDLFG